MCVPADLTPLTLPMPFASAVSTHVVVGGLLGQGANGTQALVDRRRGEAGADELGGVALHGRLVEAGHTARPDTEKVRAAPHP
jgi:hypothetical protein